MSAAYRKHVEAADSAARENLIAAWAEAIARPLLPTGWMAEAGWPPADSVCGCCRNRGWWREWWVCATCAPPLDPATEVRV